jgi:hypothetical protein
MDTGIILEEKWKTLYCTTNKTKEAPEKSYSIKEAIAYLGGIEVNIAKPIKSSLNTQKKKWKQCIAMLLLPELL